MAPLVVLVIFILIVSILLIFSVIMPVHGCGTKNTRFGPTLIDRYVELENTNIEDNRPENNIRDFVNILGGIDQNTAPHEVEFLIHRNPFNIVFGQAPAHEHAQEPAYDFHENRAQALEFQEPARTLLIATIVTRMNELSNVINRAMMNVTNPNATRQERTNIYFDRVKRGHSDTQNVHDSNITSEMRKTFLAIEQQSLFKEEGIADICNYLLESNISEAGKEKALRVLDHIRENGAELRVFSIGPDVSLERVLLVVWNRANDMRNRDRENDIKDSIVHSLVDCIEDDKVVCSGGIATNIIGALCLIDADQGVAQLQSMDMLKSEIMGRAAEIIDAAAAACAEDDNEEMRTLGRSYVDISVDCGGVSENTKRLFIARIEADVDAMLEEYSDKKLPFDIKQSIMAGITL